MSAALEEPMREFVKELEGEPKAGERRFVAASIMSSLLAPIALVLGLATLLGYDPVEDTMVLMGLPRWSLPIVGVIEIAAAAALVVPIAAFFGALAMIGICAIGAVMYLRLGEVGFALVLVAVAAAFIAELVVRAPELGKTGRRLWSAVKT